jgi:hypothetical protein
MEYDINKLKLKTTSQLSPDEKDHLRANVDKLDEYDREAYADFLTENEPVVEESITTASESEPVIEEAVVEKPTVPEAPVFKSEDEARDFVVKIQKEQDKAKQDAIDAARTPEEKKYVEDNWMPETWNEGIKTIRDIIKKELKDEQDAAQAKSVEEALDRDWNALVKEKNLPALSTQEGKEVHDHIVRYGLAAKKTTFAEAYDVWMKIPKELGGGFDNTVAPITDSKKETVSAQKKVAAKIGNSNQAEGGKSTGVLNNIDYKTFHGAKSTTDLLKKAGVL